MISSRTSTSRSARNSDPRKAPALGRRFRVCLTALLLGCLPVSAMAQGAPNQFGAQSLPRSPILMVDSERLFAESNYGARIADEMEAKAAALAAENRRLEAELAEEERELTQKRAELSPEAFRPLADAFDEKVTRIRKEREERAMNLGQDGDTARRQFLFSAQPVLDQIMREAGAAVILERRTVFVGRDVIDITDEAIALIDATLMDTSEEGEEGTATGDAGPATSGENTDDAADQADDPAATDGAAGSDTDSQD